MQTKYIIPLFLTVACTNGAIVKKVTDVPSGVTTEVLTSVTTLVGVTTTLMPPDPTITQLVNDIVEDENDYRLSLGQLPLTPGITCSLYNLLNGATPTPPQPQPSLFPTSLPSATATFTYKGSFNQGSGTGGSEVVPLAMRSLYTQWYALRCTGSIVILDSGYHNFSTISDDASLLYINNALTVSNDGHHGMQERSGARNLKRGVHSIRLDYMAGGGPSGLIVKLNGEVLPLELLWR